MSTSEEEKIPSVEKNSTREGGGPGCIGINLEGKDQHEIDQEAKKIQDPMDTEDPASRVGSAVINKEEQLSGAEKTEVLVEPDMPGGAEVDDHWYWSYFLLELGTGSEEELQVDEVAEVDDPLADWEAHLAVKKKKATSELDRYLSDPLFPRKKDVDFDILEWWQMHSIQYPVLSCIARDVLAIQASTVASESSFSAGGRIISDHRTRLKSNTVEGLLCLQDWLKADDPNPTSKDVDEEEYLVFHQASKCPKKRRARSRSYMPSSSPLSSPASSCSMSPSTSPCWP